MSIIVDRINGITPGAVQATGGTKTEKGEWIYHEFNGSGTFAVSNGGYIEALIVGGGGSGYSSDNVGGGGAGGVVFKKESISANNYTITVGAGASTTTTTAHGIAFGGADFYSKTQSDAEFMSRQDILDNYTRKWY